MLRFEAESDGNVTTIRVIGRLQASDIEDLRLALKDVESRAVCGPIAPDLRNIEQA